MYIKKIVIENFKCFQGKFELDLNEGLNILVGDNESGKSTILEAINLALSGWLNGKYLRTELNESIFNIEVVKEYLEKINTGVIDIPLPSINIDLYCDFGDEVFNELFRGNKNSKKDKQASGIRFSIFFDENKSNEYIKEVVVSKEKLLSLPIEFCDFSWEAFSRKPKIPKTIPLKSSMIDSSNARYQNGSDVNATRIIHDRLSSDEETKISQAHRKLKDLFSQDPSIEQINKALTGHNISEKILSLQIETSTKSSWEASLVPYLDDIPFQYAGKGEQCLVKTKLSLQHRKVTESNVILIEEPENHLSHSKLNHLIDYIKTNNRDKQIIISTHSSFVANKLGLRNLILLNVDEKSKLRKEFRTTSLNKDTQKYFEKLPGYDTLRLILCRKAILVEGDSDELIVQKAFLNEKKNLPLADGVDVISVRSLAFKRFLDIAKELVQPTVVVTDNDGKTKSEMDENYKEYKDKPNIKVCYDEFVDTGTLELNGKPFNYNTLEPKFFKANNLNILNKIFNQKFQEENEMHKYMETHKTDCALMIFDTNEIIKFPQYILDAINWEYE
ncbi:MAG: AAA family ATPase [Candidatus Gracilibacteria bacterium]|nr:AAA family ATPase [Candidatus Gracilibacteria bacterium]